MRVDPPWGIVYFYVTSLVKHSRHSYCESDITIHAVQQSQLKVAYYFETVRITRNIVGMGYFYRRLILIYLASAIAAVHSFPVFPNTLNLALTLNF